MEEEKKVKTCIVIRYDGGKFYNVYDEDAFILNLLFGYKVLDNKKTGFPESAKNKVINELEQRKISYQIITKDSDPVYRNFKNLNKYEEYRIKAHNNLDTKQKLDMITKKIATAPQEKLEQIVEAIEKCLIS